MQYRSSRRPDLDRGDPLVLGKGHLDDKITVDVGTGGANPVGLLHADHEVRLAKLPTILEIGQLRQARGLPLLHAGLHPPGDQLDITVLQAPGITEISMAGNRMPGRHVAALGDPGNHASAFLYIAVIQQVKGRDLPGPVAARTIIENNGRDMFAEGNLLRQRFLSFNRDCGGLFF